MAERIPLPLPPRDPRQELHLRLQNAPAEHAEALLATYEVLQGLHDRGVLDLLRGTLGASDKIIEETVQFANSPESIRAFRNTMVFFKSIGAMDPELLNAFFGAIPAALAEAKETPQPGLWTLLNKFRSKHLRRGLAMVNAFLEGFGKNLNSAKQRGADHENNK